jgi:bifunctional non-homologous end joining protein LigD
MSEALLHVGSRDIEMSNVDKVLFPEDGTTKGDLIEYYRRIADTMLPHMAGRPLTLHRFPDGIDASGFYQKEAADYYPDWIARVTVSKEGGTLKQVVCEDAATLVYLANQGCITPHVWLSRTDRPHHPDRLVIDLDPPDDDFEPVRAAAHWVLDALDEIGLPGWLMTTGSRGVHVTVPLDRGAAFNAVRTLARDLTRLIAHRHPDALTTEVRKAKRRGRLFLDVARNAYAQTAVTPYAVRPKPGAPVATPLERDELDDPSLAADRFRMGNVFRRLGQKQDPWHDIGRHARSIAEPRNRLGQLLAQEDLE